MMTDETDLEFHIPGMRFCGPGTRLDIRCNADGTPRPGYEPVDRVDEAALRHDLFYQDNPSQRARAEIGDKRMIDEVLSIANPTCREIVERAIVVPILRFKRFVTLFILRIASRWLSTRG